ncbi:MAG: F0F1 ATP synthase subunit epsilon [Pseudomonadales bacterium]
MANLHVDIVSAEKEIFSGDAEMVVASAEMGEVGIAPGHTPFISRIRPGEVHVRAPGETENLNIYVSGGILEVQPHVVTILADTALRVDELDEAAAVKAKEEAEAALSGKVGEIDYSAIQAQLAEASAQLQLIKKLRH